MVPRRGLEPPRLSSLVPETSASTNSATWAGGKAVSYGGGAPIVNSRGRGGGARRLASVFDEFRQIIPQDPRDPHPHSLPTRGREAVCACDERLKLKCDSPEGHRRPAAARAHRSAAAGHRLARPPILWPSGLRSVFGRDRTDARDQAFPTMVPARPTARARSCMGDRP